MISAMQSVLPYADVWARVCSYVSIDLNMGTSRIWMAPEWLRACTPNLKKKKTSFFCARKI